MMTQKLTHALAHFAPNQTRGPRIRIGFFVLIVIAALLAPSALLPRAVADEPAEEFVAALGENGYFDVAIEYLDRAAKNDLISADYRKRVPFEKAKVLITSISSERSNERREAKLDEADKLLSSYSAKLKDPDLKQEVIETGANIKLKRAQSYITQSGRERVSESDKKSLLKKSNTLLEASRKQYQQVRGALRKRLEDFKVDPDKPETKKQRKRLQASYIRIRTKLPTISELIGDSMTPGAKQKKAYQEAVKENQDVYDDYVKQGQVFVFEAAINGGRSAQKAGDHKKAMELLDNVFLLGDGALETRLKSKAMLVAVDSWKAIKPYPAKDVIEQLEKPVGRLNRKDVKKPAWQRIQLELANAKLAMSKSLKSKEGNGNAAKARDLNQDATKLVRGIARAVGPHREDAKALIKKYDLSFTERAGDEESQEIETFVDAKERSAEVITEIVDVHNAILAARKAGKPVDELEIDLQTKTASALLLYEKALSLANSETPRVDINFIHYQRTLCYSFQNRSLEAATIAEFLLNKYPNVQWSKQASTYIISGYTSLLNEAPKDDRGFESTKLSSACSEICKRWPGTNEASRASSKMVELSLKAGDDKMAEEFFNQVPQSSPFRASLAAGLGQKLWYNYRTQTKLPLKERQAMLNKTQKILGSAVKGAGKSVSSTTANSALSLAGVLVEQKKYGAAVKQLEDGTIGPLTLINKKNKAVSGAAASAARFRTTTYQTAIKAHLGKMSEGGDFKSAIQKATEIVGKLKKEYEEGSDPQAKLRLTAVYQNVAQQLKDQFGNIVELEDRKKFAVAMAKFLGTIEKESTDASTVLWTGSTLFNAASSLDQDAPKAAAPLFKQAVSALDRAEKIGGLNAREKLSLKHQRGLALRGSGDFSGAVDTFAGLLKETSAVNIQISAAETLQMWGNNKSDKSAYVKAMMGTGGYKKDNRTTNAIWGWRKLVQLTRGNEKLNDVYRTALYNSVKSRFEYGLLETNSVQSKKAIKSAHSELTKALAAYEFLKTGVWTKKFDALVAEMKKKL